MVKQQSRDAAVRRIAKRRGYTASRSRLRDTAAIGYGRWTVTGPRGKRVSPKDGWTLEQAEQWLTHQGQSRPADHDEGEEQQ